MKIIILTCFKLPLSSKNYKQKLLSKISINLSKITWNLKIWPSIFIFSKIIFLEFKSKFREPKILTKPFSSPNITSSSISQELPEQTSWKLSTEALLEIKRWDFSVKKSQSQSKLKKTTILIMSIVSSIFPFRSQLKEFKIAWTGDSQLQLLSASSCCTLPQLFTILIQKKLNMTLEDKNGFSQFSLLYSFW